MYTWRPGPWGSRFLSLKDIYTWRPGPWGSRFLSLKAGPGPLSFYKKKNSPRPRRSQRRRPPRPWISAWLPGSRKSYFSIVAAFEKCTLSSPGGLPPGEASSGGAHGSLQHVAFDSVTRLLYICLFSIARRQVTTSSSWWPMGTRIIYIHIYVSRCTHAHTSIHTKICTHGDLGLGVRASFH